MDELLLAKVEATASWMVSVTENERDDAEAIYIFIKATKRDEDTENKEKIQQITSLRSHIWTSRAVAAR